MKPLHAIAAHFVDESRIAEILPLGNGLINDTYQIRMQGSTQPDYVLQHINTAVFTDVEVLQTNIERVTRHIRRKYETLQIKDMKCYGNYPTRNILKYKKSPEEFNNLYINIILLHLLTHISRQR